MKRMFDDVFRGFDLTPFGPSSRTHEGLGWPQIDIDETDKDVRITAELPGLVQADEVEAAALKFVQDLSTGPTRSYAPIRTLLKAWSGGGVGRAWSRSASREFLLVSCREFDSRNDVFGMTFLARKRRDQLGRG
jgi:hypothetical protein